MTPAEDRAASLLYLVGLGWAPRMLRRVHRRRENLRRVTLACVYAVARSVPHAARALDAVYAVARERGAEAYARDCAEREADRLERRLAAGAVNERRAA